MRLVPFYFTERVEADLSETFSSGWSCFQDAAPQSCEVSHSFYVWPSVCARTPRCSRKPPLLLCGFPAAAPPRALWTPFPTPLRPPSGLHILWSIVFSVLPGYCSAPTLQLISCDMQTQICCSELCRCCIVSCLLKCSFIHLSHMMLLFPERGPRWPGPVWTKASADLLVIEMPSDWNVWSSHKPIKAWNVLLPTVKLKLKLKCYEWRFHCETGDLWVTIS